MNLRVTFYGGIMSSPLLKLVVFVTSTFCVQFEILRARLWQWSWLFTCKSDFAMAGKSALTVLQTVTPPWPQHRAPYGTFHFVHIRPPNVEWRHWRGSDSRQNRFYSARNARIASAVLPTAIPSVCPSVCLSVRPSVRLSHAGIVSKRRHVARCSLHCWIAKCV